MSLLNNCFFIVEEFFNLQIFQGESECLFPEDLRSRERTHLVFGAHFGVERGHKTMGNSMSDCIKQ